MNIINALQKKYEYYKYIANIPLTVKLNSTGPSPYLGKKIESPCQYCSRRFMSSYKHCHQIIAELLARNLRNYIQTHQKISSPSSRQQQLPRKNNIIRHLLMPRESGEYQGLARSCNLHETVTLPLLPSSAIAQGVVGIKMQVSIKLEIMPHCNQRYIRY